MWTNVWQKCTWTLLMYLWGLCTYGGVGGEFADWAYLGHMVKVNVKVMRWDQRGGIENLLNMCTLGLVT